MIYLGHSGQSTFALFDTVMVRCGDGGHGPWGAWIIRQLMPGAEEMTSEEGRLVHHAPMCRDILWTMKVPFTTINWHDLLMYSDNVIAI